MNTDFFFWLEVTSNLAQLESYRILLNDFNNYDLMDYLRHQDELLNTIIEQNKKIIERLENEWYGRSRLYWNNSR